MTEQQREARRREIIKQLQAEDRRERELRSLMAAPTGRYQHMDAQPDRRRR